MSSAFAWAVISCAIWIPAEPPASSDVDLDAMAVWIDGAREAWGVPGLAVSIVHEGDVAMARGFGVQTVGGDVPVDADTLFSIASNSKAFTATTVAMLVEEGKLAWDDRVIDHVPAFRLRDPWVTREMRVEDLLCHRSGLRTFGGDLLWYRTHYTIDDLLARMEHLEPAGRFRAHYGYQNLMYLVAGEVVHAASGESWSAFVQRRLFDPLNMNRTLPVPSGATTAENAATPHVIREGEAQPVGWVREDVLGPMGGIVSSANDLSKWLRLQLAQGEWGDERLFSASSFRRLGRIHNPLPLSNSDRTLFPSTHFKGYGLGWGVADYRGRSVRRHGGALDGMYSYTLMVPEESLAVVVLTNADTSVQTAIAYQVVDAYLGPTDRDWSRTLLERSQAADVRSAEAAAQRREARIEGTSPSRPLDDYTGRFGGPLYGDATIVRDGVTLKLQLEPAPELSADLIHWHHDVFELRWHHPQPWFGNGWCHFRLDAAGVVEEFELDVPNQDFWFDELEFRRR